MSDRIAVMSNGKIEQVAPPTEIYESPATVFVADFLGVSNLMDAVASGSDPTGRCKVKVGGFDCYAGRGSANATGTTKVTIRPERVRLEPHGSGGENRIPGTVQRWVYLGNAVQLIIGLATGAKIQALMQNTGEDIPYREGAEVAVHLPATALRILEDTGARLASQDD
jgi:ABC-type Fe3+/spermidine/putrescine transport system ATPase subunit